MSKAWGEPTSKYSGPERNEDKEECQDEESDGRSSHILINKI
jgi:hypothetical protein